MFCHGLVCKNMHQEFAKNALSQFLAYLRDNTKIGYCQYSGTVQKVLAIFKVESFCPKNIIEYLNISVLPTKQVCGGYVAQPLSSAITATIRKDRDRAYYQTNKGKTQSKKL